MPRPHLTTKQKKILHSASPEAVMDIINRLRPFFRSNKWIGSGNRYRINTIKKLKFDTKDGNPLPKSKQRHLADYIASSGILHCIDGWIFLGRAINAHSNIDKHSAHHLAYYAELRAAMSLLACEGIGVFNYRHFIIDSDLKCIKIPKGGGTHEFTWLALEHWSNLGRSRDLLMRIIRPAGIPIQDWLISFGVGVSSQFLIGSSWLKSWGLDLKSISQDHEGRNEVSYHPNSLNYNNPENVEETSKFLRSLWEVFQPTEYSRFEFLDRYLLRQSIRETYLAIYGSTPEENPIDYENRIKTMVMSLDPGGLPPQHWINFLKNNDTHPLLNEVSIEDNVRSSRHHLQVLARSAMLLRVATGAASTLLAEAGYDFSDLEFWWIQFGGDVGLWDPPFDGNFVDLWADIDSALDNIASWEDLKTPDASYYSWKRDLAQDLSVLDNCERIALWGLGL